MLKKLVIAQTEGAIILELQHDPEYIRYHEAILSFLYEKFAKDNE